MVSELRVNGQSKWMVKVKSEWQELVDGESGE